MSKKLGVGEIWLAILHLSRVNMVNSQNPSAIAEDEVLSRLFTQSVSIFSQWRDDSLDILQRHLESALAAQLEEIYLRHFKLMEISSEEKDQQIDFLAWRANRIFAGNLNITHARLARLKSPLPEKGESDRRGMRQVALERTKYLFETSRGTIGRYRKTLEVETERLSNDPCWAPTNDKIEVAKAILEGVFKVPPEDSQKLAETIATKGHYLKNDLPI